MSVSPVFLILDWFRYVMMSFGTHPAFGAFAEYTLMYSFPIGVVPLMSRLLRTQSFLIQCSFSFFYTANSIDRDRVVSSGRSVFDIVHVSVYL